MTLSTRLTQKYQTTIPLPVREVLGLEKGDKVCFEIADDKTIILRKDPLIDERYAQALQETLTEWATTADEEAYAHL